MSFTSMFQSATRRPDPNATVVESGDMCAARLKRLVAAEMYTVDACSFVIADAH